MSPSDLRDIGDTANTSENFVIKTFEGNERKEKIIAVGTKESVLRAARGAVKGSASGVQPRGKLSLSWAGKDAKLIGTVDGKYEWVGRNDVRVGEVRCLNEVERIESIASDPTPGATDDNMLIIGDSTDALRVLLKHPDYASKYRRKVKLVYIDPPFNTGQAFDHYDDGLEHSVWMTMMRDRLVQIRDLLAEDGSVWVHLDDAEMAYCKVIMDEIFGREHYVTTLAWEKSDTLKMDTKDFSSRHDHILVYSRSDSFKVNRTERTERPKHYNKQDEDGRWYCTIPFKASGPDSTRKARPTMYYGMIAPDGEVIYPVRDGGEDGRWVWSADKAESDAKRIDWTKGRNGWTPQYRIYEDKGTGLPPDTLWKHQDTGSNRTSKRELKALFPKGTVFGTPKPEKLLERIIKIASQPGDIVIDCFAGSGTTAAVAHKLGRKWVTVELSPDTARNFTAARLKKVVSGEDEGGVTYTASSLIPASEDFPEDGNFEEFKTTYKVLHDLVKSGVLDPKDPTFLKMKQLSKGKISAASKRWNGGGSFGIHQLAPSIYSVDEYGHTYIPEEVTPDTFREAMRVHCGFKKDPLLSAPFAGRQGKLILATVNGMVGESEVNKIASLAAPGSKIRVVARAYTDGAEERIEALHPGSYLEKTPDDFFSDYAGVN